MSILDKIVANKRREIQQARQQTPMLEWRKRCQATAPPKDFISALRTGPSVSLIAEVKKASPSQGLIRVDFDPVAIAKIYEQSGASCISVLTDEHFFQGHLDYLVDIRRSVHCPILRKDFIVSPYQVYQARACGADAVLLIAECLPDGQLPDLYQQVVEMQMTPLVELYHPRNLKQVLELQPDLIGINNRDLDTFEVDLQHCLRLRREIPAETLVVAESGITCRQDVHRLAAGGIQAMLVGESLMRSADIGAAVRGLLTDWDS